MLISREKHFAIQHTNFVKFLNYEIVLGYNLELKCQNCKSDKFHHALSISSIYMYFIMYRDHF